MLGVCYYPEYWSRTEWARDAAEMMTLGIRYVRIGEFGWSSIEPRRGEYCWEPLDEALAVLGDAGLKIVLCTPTATPPKWLVDEWPEILAWDVDGRPRKFGSRRHYCFSSRVWRRESAHIVAAMTSRYGNHPGVVGWQLDNEYGCHDTVLSYAPHCRPEFHDWLEQRYRDIEVLNSAWGTAFWSQRYDSFAQIDLPNLTVTEANPAHRLDYQRFSSDQVLSYHRMQVEIVRAASPGRFVTHNFMGFFFGFDHGAVAEAMDIPSWDSYPLGFTSHQMNFLSPAEQAQWARTGHPDVASFHHDLYRGMSPNRTFWVMEQQPGPVNWAPHNPAPAPGVVRLWSWEALAHGAEVVSYFPWRQLPYGQEQMHAGLQRSDGSHARGWSEVEQVASELAALEGRLGDSRRSPVALLLDYQAAWVIEIQPQGKSFSYPALLYRFYTALRRLGLDVDVVLPGADLSGYQLVVVPSLPMIDEVVLKAIAATDAVVIFGPRSGSKTSGFATPEQLAPGVLQQLIPIRIPEVESLPPGVCDQLRWRPGSQSATDRDREYPVTVWREHLESTLPATAHFADGGGAIYCKDRRYYLGFWPDEAFLIDFLEDCMVTSGIATTRLSSELRLRRRGDVVFAFNTGSSPVNAPAPDDAQFLLGQRRLLGCDVAAWIERGG